MNDGLFIEGDELESPFSSGYKRNVLTLPGRPGAIHLKDEVNPIQFDFSISFVGLDQLELQQAMRKIKKRLIDSDGKPKVVKMICSWEPDIYYNVMITDKEFENKSKWQRISDYTLSFICFDGFGMLVEEESLTWGDTVVPHGSFNYDFDDVGSMQSKQITSNDSMEFEIKGFNTLPKITLTGSGTDIYLRINNVYSKIPTLTNQTLKIDSVEKSVYLNSVMNLDVFSDMNWIDYELIPGTNLLTVTGTNLNLNITIDYDERFY
ncbi:distal tail protein Dit [Macrococcoides canis]|uniref:distal tail protein Dit n=1 Tax=Macrococcoides canis TaxID=1855823 RepID=UPI0020B7CC53|nr:distal tail protein Dit [Macrococcus canis]UTG99319.1 phage tail family protein [Macrococcus canis]